MKDANEHTFMILGEYVTVETNDAGSFLRVSFGDTQIEDSSGECVDWGPPQRWLILHGAARQSAIRKILQTVAERSIRDFIVMKGEDDDEIKNGNTLKIKTSQSVMIDRSYIDFKGVEYTIGSLDADKVTIKIDPASLDIWANRVLAEWFPRKNEAKHIVEFVRDELEGRLTFSSGTSEEDSEKDCVMYEDICESVGL